MKGRKQITLRMPKEQYEALKKESKKIGISTHEMIIHAISFFLERKLSDTDE